MSGKKELQQLSRLVRRLKSVPLRLGTLTTCATMTSKVTTFEKSYLIELFLPMFDNTGTRFPADVFYRVRNELTECFGGVTAFMRAPAVGLWQDDTGAVRRDEIAIFEVMTETLDRDWWQRYRRQLESELQQQTIVIRAFLFEHL